MRLINLQNFANRRYIGLIIVVFLCFSAYAFSVIVSSGRFADSKLLLYLLGFTVTPAFATVIIILIEFTIRELDGQRQQYIYSVLAIFSLYYLLFILSLLYTFPHRQAILLMGFVLVFLIADAGIVFWLRHQLLVSQPRKQLSVAIILTAITSSIISISFLTLWIGSGFAANFLNFDVRHILSGLCAVLFMLSPAAVAYSSNLTEPLILASIPYLALIFGYPISSIDALAISLIAVLAVVRSSRMQSLRHWFSQHTFWSDILLIIWLGLFVINLDFIRDRHHHNFYLGPINDLLHGKSLLVDANSQYGILVMYFLTAIFKTGLIPFSYVGFSLLNSFLLLLQFVFVYFILRHQTQSRFVSLVAVSLMAFVNVVAAPFPPQQLPSTGPLRFGLSYLLVGVLAFRTEYPALQKYALILEHVIVGLATIWSVETGVYVVGTYIAVTVFEAVFKANMHLGALFLTKRALTLLTSILTSILFLTVFTYLRAGAWPEWDLYLDFLRFYSNEATIYSAAFPFWNLWLFIVLIYCLSLVLIAVNLLTSRGASNGQSFLVIFAVTIVGIAHFSYYVGNTTQISAQFLPPIFVAAFWLSKLSKARDQVRLSTYWLSQWVVIILTIGLTATFASIERTVPTTAAGVIADSIVKGSMQKPVQQVIQNWNLSPSQGFDYFGNVGSDNLLPELMGLLQRYVADEERVVVLTRPDTTTDALIRLNKVQVFPMSHPPLDNLSPLATQRAANFQHTLQAGDLIFVDINEARLVPIQLVILERLKDDFRFEIIDISRRGIAVIRLR